MLEGAVSELGASLVLKYLIITKALDQSQENASRASDQQLSKMKRRISSPKPYLVYNIHLGRSLADKRIRSAEGGSRLIRNSREARGREPHGGKSRVCVTSRT